MLTEHEGLKQHGYVIDGKLHIGSGTDISATDSGGSLVIDQGSTRVRVDGNELQASVSGLASQFQLNPFHQQQIKMLQSLLVLQQ